MQRLHDIAARMHKERLDNILIEKSNDNVADATLKIDGFWVLDLILNSSEKAVLKLLKMPSKIATFHDNNRSKTQINN